MNSNVIFGRVIYGLEIVEKIQNFAECKFTQKPINKFEIVDCGLYQIQPPEKPL